MPTNDRPVIVQPNDTGIRIGAQQGRSPQAPHNLSRKILDLPANRGRQFRDTFIVYEGHSEGRSSGSLDQQAPAWRYSNKNALHSPNVPAVDEFRKLIEEARKAAENQAVTMEHYPSPLSFRLPATRRRRVKAPA